jgi:hypothetical protein
MPKGKQSKKPTTTAQPAAQDGKGQAKPESVGGYFRAIFKRNPQLLEERSNADLLKRWLRDHPGHTEVPERVKQGLANVKSEMRKQRRERTTTTAPQPAAPAVSRTPPAQAARAGNDLETLEVRIDECLSLARQMDAEGLEEVIAHLRRARNGVVWRLGE